MARLRQLPQIYLRGAIANETMKHLPAEEVRRVNDLVSNLVKSPLLSGHRQDFINRLSQTIGGDYRDDRSTADAEFNIAVWRAVVYLIYHTDCSYVCDACHSSTYLTQRARPKAMDRRYPVCPSCAHVRISADGEKWTAGTFVALEEVERALAAGIVVQYGSPIGSRRGALKVANSSEVLADPQQLSKFLSEFIWNYYRQTLRENEIKHHQINGTWVPGAGGKLRFVNRQAVAGPADRIATEEVLSVLAGAKFPHVYHAIANPQDGYYNIQANLDCADIDIVMQLVTLVRKYERLNIQIHISDRCVRIKEEISAPVAEALVIKPQAVALLTNAPANNDVDDSASIIDTNHDRIIGGRPMQEDGIAKLEADDLLAKIHSSLPDGAQQVLEIYTQTGETWQRFSLPEAEERPTAVRPPPAQIARFLGVSPKQVKQWITDIRIQCLAHGLAPGT